MKPFQDLIFAARLLQSVLDAKTLVLWPGDYHSLLLVQSRAITSHHSGANSGAVRAELELVFPSTEALN
jgi:hypothetical protein